MQMTVTLAGANFRPADAKEFIKTQLNPDTKVRLERDADNPYDSNAIKIICEDDLGEPVFIGFVPRTDNALLAIALDGNPDFPYTIKQVGFMGSIQPLFEIEFEPPTIEERNAAQDAAAAHKAEEEHLRQQTSNLDDEIPF